MGAVLERKDAVLKGRFIVFEGIDGAGKSTQIARLAKALEGAGRRVLVTAEPTSGPTGKMLRAKLSGKEAGTPAELAALFTLDRIIHNGEIKRALEAGTDVICDRYYYSTLAYQGSRVDRDWVRRMNCDCPDIMPPDVCIFLDLSPAEAMARITARGEATEIYEKEETLREIRSTFMEVFSTLPDRVEIVSAAGTPDEVHERIWSRING